MSKKDRYKRYYFIAFSCDSFKYATERILSRLRKIPDESAYSREKYDDLVKEIVSRNRTGRGKAENIFDMQRYFAVRNKTTGIGIVLYWMPLENKRVLASGAYKFGENCGYSERDRARDVKRHIRPMKGSRPDKVFGVER